MRYYIVSFIIAALYSNSIAGQKRSTDQIYVNSIYSTIENRQLRLDFELDLSEVRLKKGNSIYLYPQIVYQKDTLELPLILVNGKNAHRVYKRLSKGKKRAINALVIEELKKGDTYIDYNIAINYKSWMHQAKLILYKADCACGVVNKRRLLLEEQINDNTSFSTPESEDTQILNVNYNDSISLRLKEVKPKREDTKIRFEQGEAYIHFEQGKSEILFNFKDNRGKLNQVEAFFNSVIRDNDIQVRGIQVVGYCSIEGSYQRNMELSQQRAFAFTHWLQSRYPEISPYLFQVDWKGEDWSKLAQLISESNLYWRYGALDIIYRYGIFDGREKELMLLQNGIPYQTMEKLYFPLLRRVYYRVDYIVKPFGIEESQKIIQETPNKLSVFEMYALAESYGRNTKAYSQTIDLAAETYPTDLIASNNATAHAIARGEYIKAQLLIDRTPDSIEKFNNQGVLCTVQNKWVEAEYWFLKAIKSGSKEAKQNLELIKEKILNQLVEDENRSEEYIHIPF